VSSTLTIATASSSAWLSRPRRQRDVPLYAFFLFLPGIAFVGTRRAGDGDGAGKFRLHLLTALLLAVLLLLSACGGGPSAANSTGSGGGGTTVTPAGTYNVQVTGTSGSAQQSTNISLVVQN
jgi:hypothetical protein